MENYIDQRTKAPFVTGGILMLVAFVVPFFVGEGKTKFIFEALGDDSVEGYWKAFFLVSLVVGALLVYAGKSQLPAKSRANLGLWVTGFWFLAYLNMTSNLGDLMRIFSGPGGDSFKDFIGLNLWFPLILLAGGVGARVRQMNPSSGPAKALLAISAAGILIFMFVGHPMEHEDKNRFSLLLELLKESDSFRSYQVFAIFGALGYLMLIPAAIVALMGLGDAKLSGTMSMTSWFLLSCQALFWIAVFFIALAASNGNFVIFGFAFIGIWFWVMAETLAVGAVALLEPDATIAPTIGHFHQVHTQGGASHERTPCPKCGQRSRWIEDYGRSYCDSCEKYLPKAKIRPAVAPLSMASSTPPVPSQTTAASTTAASTPTQTTPACAKCGQKTSWIEQYTRHYCHPCQTYAPKATRVAAPVVPVIATDSQTAPSCLECGQITQWLELYKRHYCHPCKTYAPKSTSVSKAPDFAPLGDLMNQAIVGSASPTQADPQTEESEAKPAGQEPTPPCALCTFATTWIPAYERFYCYSCKKYV